MAASRGSLPPAVSVWDVLDVIQEPTCASLQHAGGCTECMEPLAGSPGVLHCCLDEFRRNGPGPRLLCQVGIQGVPRVLAWCWNWSRVASERFTTAADATAAAVVLMRSAETLLSRPGNTVSQGPWTALQI